MPEAALNALLARGRFNPSPRPTLAQGDLVNPAGLPRSPCALSIAWATPACRTGHHDLHLLARQSPTLRDLRISPYPAADPQGRMDCDQLLSNLLSVHWPHWERAHWAS